MLPSARRFDLNHFTTSLIYLISPVPCTPANISTEVDCEAKSLIVSWSESAGADSYIATLQDSHGQTTNCHGTTEGSCNVTGIGCGQIYHVSVVSSDGYCNSLSTPEVKTPAGMTAGRVVDVWGMDLSAIFHHLH